MEFVPGCQLQFESLLTRAFELEAEFECDFGIFEAPSPPAALLHKTVSAGRSAPNVVDIMKERKTCLPGEATVRGEPLLDEEQHVWRTH